MTQREANDLERLVSEYNSKHGDGKGEEVSGGLMFSFSASEQIKVFKKAGGREIILEPDPEAIDGVWIKYRPKRRGKYSHSV